MNCKCTQIKLSGFLFLLILTGFSAPFQINFAQARADGDDAKIYAEVKSKLEKYEEQISPEHKTSLEELQDKTVTDFDEILSKCELLIRHNAKMPDYYRLRGEARYYKAIANSPYIFIESNSLSDPAFTAKFSSAEIGAGIKDFSDALTINPAAKLDDIEAAAAHLFRGKLYAVSAAKNYSKQNLQNALVDFGESVRLDGYQTPPDGFRKGIYLLSKDGDLVGQDFARRIKEDPANARRIYLERAGYDSQIVDYSKALADLLHYANSADAGNATDKSIIELTYATLNKYAGDAYKKTNPSTAADFLEKASLEIQFPEKEEDAFNDAGEAVKRNPLLTSAHVIRAKVLMDKRQVDESLAEAGTALAQDPDNVGALCLRGLGLAVKNDIKTLNDFNRAISLDPELAFLYNAFGNRARIYTALGKADLAAADTQKNEQLGRKLAEIRE